MLAFRYVSGVSPYVSCCASLKRKTGGWSQSVPHLGQVMLCRSEPENVPLGGMGFWKLTNDTGVEHNQFYIKVVSRSETNSQTLSRATSSLIPSETP
jgi:hypothetical protein